MQHPSEDVKVHPYESGALERARIPRYFVTVDRLDGKVSAFAAQRRRS